MKAWLPVCGNGGGGWHQRKRLDITLGRDAAYLVESLNGAVVDDGSGCRSHQPKSFLMRAYERLFVDRNRGLDLIRTHKTRERR